MSRLSRVWSALSLSLTISAAAGSARAQAQASSGEDDPRQRSARAGDTRGAGAPLRGSLGVPVAEGLLGSADPATRLRGIARLGAIGTPEAVDALLEALEQGSPVGRDPRARLEAVRVLAAHAQRDPVRQLLTRELNEAAGAPGRGAAASPLAELTRGTAALALARAGDKRSLAALANAIAQGGAPGAAAERALAAYPPSSLQLLLSSKRRPSPEIARVLGELGDLRAIERLRPLLTASDEASQVAAALALAKLGDEAALAQARAWLRKPEPRRQPAAAEILVHLGAPDAPAAVTAMLKGEVTRLAGLRLAELLPSPAVAAQLAKAIPELPEDARPRAVAVLGRAGGPEAVKALRALLAPPVKHPELVTSAAFALANVPGEEARDALAALLADPAAGKDRDRERLLLRAAVVRALSLRDPPIPLEERLRPLLAAKDERDRAVAAFGLAAIGATGVVDEIARACAPAAEAPEAKRPRCDGAALHAAARGALARGGAALAPFAALLEAVAAGGGGFGGVAGLAPAQPPSVVGREPAPAVIAAGVALLAAPDGGAIPTSQLAAWAEGGGALAPLAARALASRDDEVVRGTLKRLLEGSDPVIRAHVALGLGRDPEPDSVSLLAAAYRFEEDPAVRRAIVRGLSRRAEAQRKRTLVLARDLDPDPAVRSLARSALLDARRLLDEPASPLATGVAWVTIVPNHPDAAPAAAGRPARMIRPDGLAIPVVADPDGALLVPGVPPGPGAVTLASAVPSGEPGRR